MLGTIEAWFDSNSAVKAERHDRVTFEIGERVEFDAQASGKEHDAATSVRRMETSNV